MNLWNNFRHIKNSRKEHVCVFCNQKIPIGSRYTRFVGEWQGDFQNWCLCDFCNDYYNYFNLDWSEGISDLSNELQECILSDYKCSSCGHERVDYEYSTAQSIIIFDCDACGHKETVSLRKAVGMEVII